MIKRPGTSFNDIIDNEIETYQLTHELREYVNNIATYDLIFSKHIDERGVTYP